MKNIWRRWSPLLAISVLAVGMLAPATAFASNDGWTVLRLILISGEDVIYDSNDDPDGEQLPAKGGSNTDRLLFGIETNVVHLSCSDGLPAQITLPDDGGTVDITDGVMYTANPSGRSLKLCGNEDLLREPPPTDMCPNLDGIYPEIPEGMELDDDGNCVEPTEPPTDVCPNLEGMQTEIPAGLELDDDGNCVEPEILDETQTREDEQDDGATPASETAVLGVTLQQAADADELPATGAGSLLSLVLAGLVSLGLGGVMLRRRDDTA
jgi:LPXTG-motif cell wall-anchored protein